MKRKAFTKPDPKIAELATKYGYTNMFALFNKDELTAWIEQLTEENKTTAYMVWQFVANMYAYDIAEDELKNTPFKDEPSTEQEQRNGTKQ